MLPDQAAIWQHVEKTARHILSAHGYNEIRTPILENTEVFTRSIGESSDIVKKEMYTFKDKKGRSLTLRPEGTAPIVRAYIEHSLHTTSHGSRLYYTGPMFRSERPQKGRTRQFYQIGAEFFGSKSFAADIEIVTLLHKLLESFKLKGFVIKLNSLGCKNDKDDFSVKLRGYLESKKNNLCEDCKARIKTNVLRVLDCKKDSCLKVVQDAPSLTDSLCPECGGDFDNVKKGLKKMAINFIESRNIVRGLDYYTGVVFEVTHPALGAQDAIAAGGRYDNLVKEMGGVDTPAVGFALGLERVILALGEKAKWSKKNIYVATLGETARMEGLIIAHELRNSLGTDAVVITQQKDSSLKSQLREANKLDASVVIMIGEDELSNDEVTFKYMKEKIEDKRVKRSSVFSEVTQFLGKA